MKSETPIDQSIDWRLLNRSADRLGSLYHEQQASGSIRRSIQQILSRTVGSGIDHLIDWSVWIEQSIDPEYWPKHNSVLDRSNLTSAYSSHLDRSVDRSGHSNRSVDRLGGLTSSRNSQLSSLTIGECNICHEQFRLHPLAHVEPRNDDSLAKF